MVLKAGSGYVPLHPAFPSERLALILSDSPASAVLTQQFLSGQVRESTANVTDKGAGTRGKRGRSEGDRRLKEDHL